MFSGLLQSRKEAVKAGHKHYFGSKCSKNESHGSVRKTRNWSCVACERDTIKRWKSTNNGKVRAQKAKRRSYKLLATPPWYEYDSVAYVYKRAEELKMDVDHVVPLLGKTVCGLHCWANLQLLSKTDNISKGNRTWPDSWEELKP